jgi:hypothetical protein
MLVSGQNMWKLSLIIYIITLMKNLLTTILALALTAASAAAQNRMSLEEAIHAARHQSVEALEARQAFISTYWAYRSYKASKLPSVYLYGDIMNFDRSLTLLQNPEDGSLKYVSSNNLQNGVGLQIISLILSLRHISTVSLTHAILLIRSLLSAEGSAIWLL